MSAQDRQTLSLPSLRNLQAFIAVANALSIHQAAEQLNVTLRGQPSDRVAGVVDGQEIIHPQRQGVQLTPTGEKYLREVSAAMSAIGRATDQIVKEKDNAVLRVHSSPTFGLSWLLRRRVSFAPNIPISPSISPAPMRICNSPEIILILISATVSRTGMLTG